MSIKLTYHERAELADRLCARHGELIFFLDGGTVATIEEALRAQTRQSVDPCWTDAFNTVSEQVSGYLGLVTDDA